MVSERMLGLGTARSVIRELFEYGKQRAAVVGAENVFDFSLGNPSVPAPAAVNETAIRILRENPDLINPSRKRRIAAGAGMKVEDVNRLLNSFSQMKQMMKKFGGGRKFSAHKKKKRK